MVQDGMLDSIEAIAGVDTNSLSHVFIAASLDKIPNFVGEFVSRGPIKYICDSIWKWIFED